MSAQTTPLPTVHERDMLKTRVPERDMSVTTFLNQRFPPDVRHPWTAVWAYPRGGPYAALVWLHFWQGPTTVGGARRGPRIGCGAREAGRDTGPGSGRGGTAR